jgi:hypothetical protein
MELPDDTPRLPKLPFLIGDLILLSVAALLAFRMGTDPTTAEVVGVVVTTGLAVAVGLAPFIVGYARQQETILRDRERLLERLVQSTASATDQASIAAAGLNEIAEQTKQNLRRLDDLPAAIQAARAAAESEQTAAADDSAKRLRDDLLRLEEKLSAQTDALGKRLDAAIKTLDKSIATAAPVPPAIIPPPAPPIETPPSKPASRKKTATRTNESADELLFGGDIVSDEAPIAAEAKPPPPPRKRKSKPKPKAPKPENASPPVEPSATKAETPSESKEPAKEVKPAAEAEVPEDPVELPAPAESPAAPAAREPVEKIAKASPPPAEEPAAEIDEPETVDEPSPAEPAISADGNTRLTVTAYIGIGNRLFIRGEGPGLSRDEGIPLQFVSIGKWRWESDAATEPVKVTLWKNDEVECVALGEIEIQPGAQLETSANF